jgi:Cu/Ag efflux pump CusA
LAIVVTGGLLSSTLLTLLLLPKLFERFGGLENLPWNSMMRYLPWRKV